MHGSSGIVHGHVRELLARESSLMARPTKHYDKWRIRWVDENGKRTGVILPVEEYERLIEELEALEDIRAFDEAVAARERGEDEVIPFDQAFREIREGRVTSD